MPGESHDAAFDDAVEALRDLGLEARTPDETDYPRHQIFSSQDRQYDLVQLEEGNPYALLFLAVGNDLADLPDDLPEQDVLGTLDFVEEHCILLGVDARGLEPDADVVEFSARLHLPSADGQTVYETWKAVDDAYHLYLRESDRLFALGEASGGGGREPGGGRPSMHL